MAGLSRREWARQLIHIAMGGAALLVVFLGPVSTVLLASAALLHNLFLLPHWGRYLWRRHELERGGSVGMVVYPITLLVTAVIFAPRAEIVAAVWALLAVGDGMATVVGKLVGGRPLPWNSDKTWAGWWGFLLCGGFAVWAALVWTRYWLAQPVALGFLAAVALAVAAWAAWLESQPLGIDDNLPGPLLSGLLLLGLLASEGFWLSALSASWPQWAAPLAVGVAVSLLLALPALAAGSLDVSGVVGAVAVGAPIWAGLGPRGFALLVVFFVLGTAATKVGRRRKAEHGLAQEKGGRRSAGNALANGGVAAACAVFAWITPWHDAYALAFAGALAAAAADTLGSELGQLAGRPRLITTGQAVPRGTDGGVTWLGTVAGGAGALLISLLGWQLGLYSLMAALWVTAAGLTGSAVDSLAGALLERRGMLGNEAVNFLATLGGALTAAAWLLAFG